MASSSSLPDVRSSALVVAHPGHELRVHGWLEQSRPVVFVLTDGSGSRGRSRLHSTTRVLERANAARGIVYGAFTDRELYAAVLSGDTSWLTRLAVSLLHALREHDVQLIAGDALEGFNPAHDLCRYLIDAVVVRLRREGRDLSSYAFALDAPPGGGGPRGRVCHELSDDAFARKLDSARSYEGLQDEVRRALSSHGEAAFRQEVFWAADDAFVMPPGTPAYERYGEDRHAKGVYGAVIRQQVHIAPLVDALRHFAAGEAV